MKTVHTNCAFGYGDNLVHLNFLRRLAIANPDVSFVHQAPANQVPALEPLVEDLHNATVRDLGSSTPDGSLDVWRGAGGWWYEQPDRNDFVSHSLRWFDILAARMGLANPVKTAADMLFDFPALDRAHARQEHKLDVLLIDSQPMSGQFRAWNQYAFRDLWQDLATNNRVLTTSAARELGMSLTDIGAVAARCRYVVGVPTGPIWLTFNRHAVEAGVKWAMLLDYEAVNITAGSATFRTYAGLREYLKQEGVL